jgi:hypothetical protein
MNTQQPDLHTPTSATELYYALRQAWQQQMLPGPCTRAGLLILIAHWALETDWGKSCFNYNLGNRKWVNGCGYDWVELATDEFIQGKRVHIVPPAIGCRFVAYNSLLDGAHDYLRHFNLEFRTAWPAVVAGNVAAFAHQLAMAHYYTAPEAEYTAGLERTVKEADARIGPDTVPEVPDAIEDSMIAFVEAQAAIEQAANEDNSEQPTPPGDLPEAKS